MQTVLLSIGKYPPYQGGSPNYFEMLVNSLSDDHEFVVLTAYHPDEPLVQRTDDAVIYRTTVLNRKLPAPVRLALESLLTFISAFYIYVTYGVDLTHAHSTSYGVPGLILASILARIPIIFSCRDASFPPRLIQIGQTPVWFSCAPNIDDRLRTNGIPNDRIIRTPVVNPPYVKKYASSDTSPDEPFSVGFVGLFREDKNVPLVVDAFAEFRDSIPDSRLVLVGDGVDREEVDRRVEAHGLDDAVEITGLVDHEDAVRRLSTLDALVLPSDTEGMPRVIIEAFELGVPVVATPVGSIPELIADRETGLLVEKSSTALTDSLLALAEDEKLYGEIVNRAREQAKTHSWETVEERVESGYKRATN